MHSIIDEEIKYGLAVTGTIHPDKIYRNVGVQEGDALILTKPLGTGIITTALKKGKAAEESVDQAVRSMTTLNATASDIMRKFAVHACSDITGFGILGHGLGMACGSGVTLVIESAKLPLLLDAAHLAEKGYITGGCKRNREFLQDKIFIEKLIREGLIEVALDPQTSGGLLIAVPTGTPHSFSKSLRARVSTRQRKSAMPPRCKKPGYGLSEPSVSGLLKKPIGFVLSTDGASTCRTRLRLSTFERLAYGSF